MLALLLADRLCCGRKRDPHAVSELDGAGDDQRRRPGTGDGSRHISRNAILFVHYRRSGTGSCASGPDAELATPLPLDGTQLGPGDYTVTAAASDAFAVGSYLVCGWLLNADDSSDIFATSFSTTFTVTVADTLSIGSVADPVEGRALDVTATGKGMRRAPWSTRRRSRQEARARRRRRLTRAPRPTAAARAPAEASASR
jgi:hypothetical protein